MPIPLILGAIAVASGGTGLVKVTKGAIDTKNANEIQEEAQEKIEEAQLKITKVKDNTSLSIQELGKLKLASYANELKDFVDNFSKIKNIKLSEINIINESDFLSIATDVNLKSMNDVSLKAMDVLGGGVAGVGAGALLGWGTYGGVMALGSASTGTAIAGLHGVAATNATLAWLGGGAIASGGGGIALGTMVLGGIIAGPALLVAGGIFGAMAKTKLNNAYSNLERAEKVESDIKTAIVELEYINATSNQVSNLLKQVRKYSDVVNRELMRIVLFKTDWNTFTQDEKNIVAFATKQAQLLKRIIDTPLLTESGELTDEIKELKKLEYK